MSFLFNNSQEKSLKNNEEAIILREIFNIIEAKKNNKEIENKDNELLAKYKIKNIKLGNISNDLNKPPKNRFKSKLQKILIKKIL